MDVKSISNGQFHITLGPTTSKMLNEMAYAKEQDAEKVLASMVFITIVSEHTEMGLRKTIEEHKKYWDR